MDKCDCYRVGRIVKSFGYKGTLILFFDKDQAQTYRVLPSIFVDIEGELVPFFLEDFQVRDDQTALVKFDDIASDDQAKKLVNGDLYLPLGTLPVQDRSLSFQSKIEGYKVFDQQQGYIGIVQELLPLKKQDLLKVIHLEKEILIPAVEEYIVSIDNRRKEIHLDLPEGLLDLNP